VQAIINSVSRRFEVLAMSRVFAYSRVSTGVQTNENQKLAIEQAGFQIAAGRYFEDVISGSTPAMTRPQFRRMMDKLEAGDAVVVRELSRLGRDAIDCMSTVKAFQELGVKLVVLQLGTLDLTSSAGTLIVNVLAACAEMEKSLLIERVQTGLARARAEGKKLGRPNKTNEAQRAEIASKRASGVSVSQIARDYGISRATVLSVLGA
jgi:putative DNA-invertase from lambdoid prophage Rac